MRGLSWLVLAAVVTAPTSAGAQATPTPQQATALSVSATLLGVAILPLAADARPPLQSVGLGIAAAAVIVGPSTGFFYGGMTGRGLRSTLLRTACAGAVVYGAANSDINVFDSTSGNGAAISLLVVGGVLGVALIVHDLVTVGPAVRARHAGGITVQPLADGNRVGVRITPSFAPRR